MKCTGMKKLQRFLGNSPRQIKTCIPTRIPKNSFITRQKFAKPAAWHRESNRFG
jgi:hypothetical protein